MCLTGLSTSNNVFCQSLKIFIQDGRYGFTDTNDKIVIAPEYDYAMDFCEGCELTVVAEGEYYQSSDPGIDPNIYFKGQFGLINFNGDLLIPPIFDIYLNVAKDYAIMGEGTGLLRFDNWPNVAEIHFEGVSGVISTAGDTIVPFIMSQVRYVDLDERNLWIVNQSDREGYSLLNDKGQNLSYDFFDEILGYNEGLFRIRDEGKYGFIDTSGWVTIPPIYENASDFRGGLTSVQLGEGYFMIFSTGSRASNVSLTYDSVYSYSEGFAKVEIFNKAGFVDESGYFLGKPEYINARSFYDGLAAVETENKFGYLHTDGYTDMTNNYRYESVKSLLTVDSSGENINQKIDLDEIADTSYFFYPVKDWDLKTLTQFSLEAFRWAPYIYYQYPHMLPKVMSGEGTLAGRYLLNRDFWNPGNEKWESLKKTVLFPVLSSETSRKLMWNWIQPAFRKIWLSMPELHRDNYHQLFDYLESYLKKYPRDEIMNHLNSNESEFAYYHFDGSHSPYRKTSALIDRLILIHGVFSETEAASWIIEINQSLSEWDETIDN
ncbi:WG repeat-containing protein [Bacteroidota bacterium]